MNIEVNGRLHIGKQMEIIQKAENHQARGPIFDAGRPAGMPRGQYTPRLTPRGELAMRRLSYSFRNTNKEVYIENAGLKASYGIFGGPGSGKTYLLRYLLKQIFEFNGPKSESPNLEQKFGGLILDPKANLIDDLREIAEETGRELIVLNTADLIQQNEAVNVINVALPPYELGKMIVVAAQAMGAGTSDPYWGLAWGNVFGAAVPLLKELDPNANAVTLNSLMDSVLTVKEVEEVDENGNRKRVRKRLIEIIARDNANLSSSRNLEIFKNTLDGYYKQDAESMATIENIIRSAYTPFLLSDYQCYSQVESEALARKHCFYDQIIEDGKIIVVSLSPTEPEVAKTLCTLIKCLFQRTVLGRGERCRTGQLSNDKRLLVLACDEYSQVASEVPGKGIGDGDFFSLSREFGCMSLIATQSISMMQNSSLKDAWRGIFSNFGANIFMRLTDNETVKEAIELAGEHDFYVTSEGTSVGKDGRSNSTNTELRERKLVPGPVFTQVLRTGDAVITGRLDGGQSQGFPRFVHVPKH
jgi:hypothetical protein